MHALTSWRKARRYGSRRLRQGVTRSCCITQRVTCCLFSTLLSLCVVVLGCLLPAERLRFKHTGGLALNCRVHHCPRVGYEIISLGCALARTQRGLSQKLLWLGANQIAFTFTVRVGSCFAPSELVSYLLLLGTSFVLVQVSHYVSSAFGVILGFQ
jgi:hypothetical protein